MDVFGFYDCSLDAPAGQAAMVTLWARGWANRGWNPRLITARHARRSKFYTSHKDKAGAGDLPNISLLALHAVGGGLLTPLTMMNFEFPVTPARKDFEVFGCGGGRITRAALEKVFKQRAHSITGEVWCVRYGEPRWSSAPLVHFSDPKDALDCGRPL